MTKRLVELHGGAIRVQSEPDRGSCFIFTLPAGQQTGVAEKGGLYHAG
ncbi:MAG: hypothetical protein HZA17_13175 [Nitrospirae bacterium]|nr:hypothetical protein [Nitrospirota bacterium]